MTKYKILEVEKAQAGKVQAIGTLAAGIAHEINTPAQYVSDNLSFLSDSFGSLNLLLAKCADLKESGFGRSGQDPIVSEICRLSENLDFEMLRSECPAALMESISGIERIAEIVRAMKAFAHPGSTEKKPTDLNKSIRDTVTVARNEWKYVSDVRFELSPGLPLVPCFAGEFNQVILNLVVNAAQAIGETVKTTHGHKGILTITTAVEGEYALIQVADTGPGIPENIRDQVFDPFFTTKPIGSGSGQGLAIAHSVIIDKHNGRISFDTEVGKGTTFSIHLPLRTKAPSSSEEDGLFYAH